MKYVIYRSPGYRHASSVESRLDASFSSLPAFEADSEQNLPMIALICWLTLGFLVFGITWGEVKARGRAEQITTDLRRSGVRARGGEGIPGGHPVFHRGRRHHHRRDGRMRSLNKAAERN